MMLRCVIINWRNLAEISSRRGDRGHLWYKECLENNDSIAFIWSNITVITEGPAAYGKSRETSWYLLFCTIKQPVIDTGGVIEITFLEYPKSSESVCKLSKKQEHHRQSSTMRCSWYKSNQQQQNIHTSSISELHIIELCKTWYASSEENDQSWNSHSGNGWLKTQNIPYQTIIWHWLHRFIRLWRCLLLITIIGRLLHSNIKWVIQTENIFATCKSHIGC